jgi:hypothetical protein
VNSGRAPRSWRTDGAPRASEPTRTAVRHPTGVARWRTAAPVCVKSRGAPEPNEPEPEQLDLQEELDAQEGFDGWDVFDRSEDEAA